MRSELRMDSSTVLTSSHVSRPKSDAALEVLVLTQGGELSGQPCNGVLTRDVCGAVVNGAHDHVGDLDDDVQFGFSAASEAG